MRLFSTAMLFLLIVSGCAHKPPPRLSCNFDLHNVRVDTPAADADYSQEVDSKLLIHNRAEADNAMLFLSGGSQHGAYGAGYLSEWQGSGSMPRFRVVTGISTGAILATGAFIGDMDTTVRGYSIKDERQLITPWAKGKGVARYLKVLKRGAFADLVPLRTEMRRMLTDAVLDDVAAGADAHRALYVGAVDVDTGDAVAFDLTTMAQRHRAAKRAGDTAAQEAMRACYVEAIVASSSAPLAAPPVYIDNRMYVDGGIRFGMFSNDIGDRVNYHKDGLPVAGGEDDRPRMYVIVNGDQSVSLRCGKADENACTTDYPAGRNEKPKDWNLLDLALRSEGILVNGIYRFSAKRIEDQAEQEKNLLYFTRIESDVAQHVAKIDDDTLDRGEMQCAVWRERDRTLLNPIQFYPRYMRCLIDYGRTRAKAAEWWKSRDEALTPRTPPAGTSG